MQRPKISVILPVANGERYLAKAIQSILAQSFTDFELIIVVDGSTDATQRVIEGFPDRRIRVFVRPHSGITASLNFGLQQAEAPIIARMDADDISLKDRLGIQIAYLRAAWAPVAVGGGVKVIDGNDQPIRREYIPPTSHAEIVHRLESTQSTPFFHPATAFRRDVAIGIGGYNPRFSLAQDLDLWLRFSRAGKLGAVPEPILLLRRHSHSISATKTREQLVFSIAARACHRIRGAGHPDPSQQATDQAWLAFLDAIEGEVDDAFLLQALVFRQRMRATPDPRLPIQLLYSCVKNRSCMPKLTALIRYRTCYVRTVHAVVDSWANSCTAAV